MELSKEEKECLSSLFKLFLTELASANNFEVFTTNFREDGFTYNLGECPLIPYLPVTASESELISKVLMDIKEDKAASFYKKLSEKL